MKAYLTEVCDDSQCQLYACLPATKLVKIFQDTCVLERGRWRGGRCMYGAVYHSSIKHSCFFLNGNVNAARYRYGVLRRVGLPLIQRHFPRGIFKQDSVCAHRAHLIKIF